MAQVSNGIVLKGQIFKSLSKKLGGGKGGGEEGGERRKQEEAEEGGDEDQEEERTKVKKQLQLSIWGQLLCLRIP